MKNLIAYSGCNQILRVAQDETMIGKLHFDTAPFLFLYILQTLAIGHTFALAVDDESGYGSFLPPEIFSYDFFFLVFV